MAILAAVDIKQTGLWPQGDERDPLGIWGARLVVVGDASGGGIKVQLNVPANISAHYVYTCYSVTMTAVAQAVVAGNQAKCRLLTQWPDIDATVGVTAFAYLKIVQLLANSSFTAPFSGPDQPLVDPHARFILLFDPRASVKGYTMVELEQAVNVLADQYAFEGYGYFWDRSVLQAPGGPRHPGSS